MEKNVFTPGAAIFFPCKRGLVKPYLKMPLLNCSHDAYSELLMSKSARHQLENLLIWLSGKGIPTLFSGYILGMTKSVGIILSRVVANSGKREAKLLSVEEIFNFASGLQKLEFVEEITISGKEESKIKF